MVYKRKTIHQDISILIFQKLYFAYFQYHQNSFVSSTAYILMNYLTLIFFFLLKVFIIYQISIVISWIIAHTINAVINGQLFVVIRNYGISRNLKDFTDYAMLLKNRILNEKSIFAERGNVGLFIVRFSYPKRLM